MCTYYLHDNDLERFELVYYSEYFHMSKVFSSRLIAKICESYYCWDTTCIFLIIQSSLANRTYITYERLGKALMAMRKQSSRRK